MLCLETADFALPNVKIAISSIVKCTCNASLSV